MPLVSLPLAPCGSPGKCLGSVAADGQLSSASLGHSALPVVTPGGVVSELPSPSSPGPWRGVCPAAGQVGVGPRPGLCWRVGCVVSLFICVGPRRRRGGPGLRAVPPGAERQAPSPRRVAWPSFVQRIQGPQLHRAGGQGSTATPPSRKRRTTPLPRTGGTHRVRTGDAWAFGNDRLAVGRAGKRWDWMTRNREVDKGMGCERQPERPQGRERVVGCTERSTSTYKHGPPGARPSRGRDEGCTRAPRGLPPPRPGRGPTRRLGAQR